MVRELSAELNINSIFNDVMFSVAFPENVPRIEGLREMYTIGEFMEANCTAKMTYPMAQVTWYINNIEVSSYEHL